MEVLSNIGSQKTRPDVAVEALNFIFDVYSDCAFDYDAPVYVQGKFNQQLKQILPAVKAMVTNFCAHTQVWKPMTNQSNAALYRSNQQIDERTLISETDVMKHSWTSLPSSSTRLLRREHNTEIKNIDLIRLNVNEPMLYHLRWEMRASESVCVRQVGQLQSLFVQGSAGFHVFLTMIGFLILIPLIVWSHICVGACCMPPRGIEAMAYALRTKAQHLPRRILEQWYGCTLSGLLEAAINTSAVSRDSLYIWIS